MLKPSLLLYPLLAFSITACDLAKLPRQLGGGGGGASRHHRIEDGETLSSIATREYGDPLQWPILKENNPWADPENLRPGDILYVPPLGHSANPYNIDPNAAADEAEPLGGPLVGSKKPQDGGFFQNIVPTMDGRTLFGEPVDKVGFIALGGFLIHALIQGFLLWIVGTITFVKDISLKKSLRASFQTELITLFTVVVLGGVAILMLHIGTTAPDAGNNADLLETVETYLQNPVAPVVAGFSIFGLYLLFCMRFIPQAFGLRRAQSLLLLFLAILLPHLLGLYTVSQRLGIIRL